MSFELDIQNPFSAEQRQSETLLRASDSMGLKIEQFFSTPGVHPVDQLEWALRSARIAGDDGQAIFEQDDIEVPTSWSQLATKVVASKYFYGDIGSGQRENSVKQLVHRVCKAIAARG
ncbi:MAG: hypothetical protein JSW47_10190, partial [Phycisphaerales bacterium]